MKIVFYAVILLFSGGEARGERILYRFKVSMNDCPIRVLVHVLKGRCDVLNLVTPISGAVRTRTMFITYYIHLFRKTAFFIHILSESQCHMVERDGLFTYPLKRDIRTKLKNHSRNTIVARINSKKLAYIGMVQLGGDHHFMAHALVEGDYRSTAEGFMN